MAELIFLILLIIATLGAVTLGWQRLQRYQIQEMSRERFQWQNQLKLERELYQRKIAALEEQVQHPSELEQPRINQEALGKLTERLDEMQRQLQQEIKEREKLKSQLARIQSPSSPLTNEQVQVAISQLAERLKVVENYVGAILKKLKAGEK